MTVKIARDFGKALLIGLANAAIVIGVFGVYSAGYADGQRSVTVDCPTEDSCTVDYYDRAWRITPVNP